MLKLIRDIKMNFRSKTTEGATALIKRYCEKYDLDFVIKYNSVGGNVVALKDKEGVTLFKSLIGEDGRPSLWCYHDAKHLPRPHIGAMLTLVK